MRIKFFVFLVAMFLLNIRYGFCANYIMDNVISTDLDNMYLVHAFSGHKQLCSSLLEGIKSNSYTVVKPIVSADDYQDLVLKVYTDKCPDLYLNRDVEIKPGDVDYAETLSEKEKEEIGTVIYYTNGFRIYHVDLDNDSENGKEFVFYRSGGYLAWAEEFINTASFLVVDFLSCKVKGVFGSSVSLHEDSKEGIMRYGGKYYVYYFHYDKTMAPFSASNKANVLVVGEFRRIGSDKEGLGTYSPRCVFYR